MVSASGKKGRLYVPPTFDEMTELTQVENLYKSNLFKLSMDECLKQISVTKKLDDLNAFLKSLKSFFQDEKVSSKVRGLSFQAIA